MLINIYNEETKRSICRGLCPSMAFLLIGREVTYKTHCGFRQETKSKVNGIQLKHIQYDGEVVDRISIEILLDRIILDEMDSVVVYAKDSDDPLFEIGFYYEEVQEELEKYRQIM